MNTFKKSIEYQRIKEALKIHEIYDLPVGFELSYAYENRYRGRLVHKQGFTTLIISIVSEGLQPLAIKACDLINLENTSFVEVEILDSGEFKLFYEKFSKSKHLYN